MNQKTPLAYGHTIVFNEPPLARKIKAILKAYDKRRLQEIKCAVFTDKIV